MKESNNQDGWQDLLKMCSRLKTTQDFESLFNVLLTIDERKDVIDRYLIIRDLLNGAKTQREMAQSLKVSIAKITRGSNSLKTISDDLRNFLQKHMK